MHQVTNYTLFIKQIKHLAIKPHIFFSLQHQNHILTIRTNKQTTHFNFSRIPPELVTHYIQNATNILNQKLTRQLTIFDNE
jgi:hypothetical protein